MLEIEKKIQTTRYRVHF